MSSHRRRFSRLLPVCCARPTGLSLALARDHSVEYPKVRKLPGEETVHVLRKVKGVGVVAGDGLVEVVIPGSKGVPCVGLLVGREAVDVHLRTDLKGGGPQTRGTRLTPAAAAPALEGLSSHRCQRSHANIFLQMPMKPHRLRGRLNRLFSP